MVSPSPPIPLYTSIVNQPTGADPYPNVFTIREREQKNDAQPDCAMLSSTRRDSGPILSNLRWRRCVNCLARMRPWWWYQKKNPQLWWVERRTTTLQILLGIGIAMTMCFHCCCRMLGLLRIQMKLDVRRCGWEVPQPGG